MSPAHTLAVYGRESRAQITSLARTPQFLVPSLAVPIGFYAMIGLGLSHGQEAAARFMLAGYVIFAAITPSLFGFGAGLAAEREGRLIELKRVSPMPIGAYLAARMAASLAVVGLALAGLSALAVYGGVQMPAWRWAAVLGLALSSAVPFSLIGMNIGLRLGSQAATASANLLFLTFCLLGGLWFPIDQLPAWLTKVSWVLPSFHFGQLSLMLAGLSPVKDVAAHVGVLAVITIAAAAGAWIGWKRQTN